MPNSNPNPNWPASLVFAVIPSDSVSFTQGEVRQLYIGTSGDVSVVQAGSTIVFKSVNAGSTIGPFFITRVNATGTTAQNIVAFT
jgi:hypothetical protein